MESNKQFHCFTAVVKWMFRKQKALERRFDKKECTKSNEYALTDGLFRPREIRRKRVSQEFIIFQPQTFKTVFKQLSKG